MMVTERVKEIWVTFAGVLEVPIVRSAFDLFQKAHQDGIEKVHLLIHSPGGGINEGVVLYNYFRSIPMEIIAYNFSAVSSAAVLVYLGADKRIVAPNATFMIHKTVVPVPHVATGPRLQAATNAVGIDDDRVEAILREHASLSPEQWAIHSVADLTLRSDESIECGIAHEIGHFAPAGPLFNF
jgi:ATP-dependent protease ClpP protease subunit